jgi:hypothetical protein
VVFPTSINLLDLLKLKDDIDLFAQYVQHSSHAGIGCRGFGAAHKWRRGGGGGGIGAM